MMSNCPPWDEHQVAEIQPHVERIRQEVIQCFPEWLAHQTLKSDMPDAVGDFKHRLLHLVGSNLKKLGLDTLQEDLEKRVSYIIRNAEAAADARQLVRDVRSWLATHGDSTRAVRIAVIRDLRDDGKHFASRLVGITERISMPEIATMRAELSAFLAKMKDAEEQITKRLSRLLKAKLRSEDDLDKFLAEVEALVNAFENCPIDLRDLHTMRQALRTYYEDHKQLRDDRLTWPEYENLVEKLRAEAKNIINEKEVPWPPEDVIGEFAESITKRRKEASKAWIDELEAEVAAISSMPATDANRLHNRASSPPPALTEPHAKYLAKILKSIETRLGLLKIEWLVEKFKELPAPLRKKFLQLVADENE